MQRKIVQIAVSPPGDSMGTHDVMYAVADDGTLWKMGAKPTWERLPDLPQQDTAEVLKAAVVRGARGVRAV
jgi:hypothetical protein